MHMPFAALPMHISTSSQGTTLSDVLSSWKGLSTGGEGNDFTYFKKEEGGEEE